VCHPHFSWLNKTRSRRVNKKSGLRNPFIPLTILEPSAAAFLSPIFSSLLYGQQQLTHSLSARSLTDLIFLPFMKRRKQTKNDPNCISAFVDIYFYISCVTPEHMLKLLFKIRS